MKKKIAKLGIIAVLTFALILSSLGALPFGNTLAKEFDIGAKNQTNVHGGGSSPFDVDFSSNKITAQAAITPAAGFEGDGDGSQAKPFLIATAEQLAFLAQQVNSDATYSNGKFFKLTADIVLNDISNLANWGAAAPANAWTPIGNDTNPFNGEFDGCGHTVSGIYIKGDVDNQGLFGKTSGNTMVKNVGVINSYIKGKDNIGGVVARNFGKVTNCFNTGAVTGTQNIGGVVGNNNGNAVVINCYNRGAVIGTQNAGGVAGLNYSNGTVSNCYNTGAVTGTTSCAGGVVGYNENTVANCYNTGAVSGTTTNIGGVVGNNQFDVTNCYFLKTTGINETLNAAGSVADTKTDTCGYFGGTDGALTAEAGEIIGKNKKLFDALNAGATAYNTTEPAPAILATEWVEVTNSYPKHKPIEIIPDPTPDPNEWTYPGTAPTKPFAVGEGTVGAPYLISTAQELANMSYLINTANTTYNGKDVHYKLTANIELNDTTGWEKWGATPPANAWTPIGVDKDFNGKFDGAGHIVSGIYISGTADYQGLFGSIRGTATVQNVGVIKSYIKGRNYVGGVVGYNFGAITNCYNLGSVNGTVDNIGGVVGQNNSGEITNCYNTGDVTGRNYVGGVVGYNPVGAITNCYNTGAVTGTNNIGGVAGQHENGTVTNCYNRGIVRGAQMVGGVVGLNRSTVANCYNRGAVTGTTATVGGVVGYNSGDTSAVENCYNTGAVSETTTKIGGVAGWNDGGTVKNSYFLKITGTNSTNETLNAVGTGRSTECGTFIATDGTLTPEAGEIIGNNKKLLDALNAGRAAYNTAHEAPATPAMAWAAGADVYPEFTTGEPTPPPEPEPEPTKPFAKGEGTATAPYEISTAQELTKLSELINAADATYSVAGVHYKLTADIKLNGDKTITSASTDATAWTPIGKSDTNSFKGVFDGAGHTVSGIYINGSAGNQGLFGVTSVSATVKNVGVINSYIKGKDNVGGVVGNNYGGVVINCYNRGDVNGSGNVGGVVGCNLGTADNCYNNGAVTGTTDNAGGVAGTNGDVVINCYNTGKVKGSSEVGGVVGSNPSGGVVINCYNRGDVNGTTSDVGGVVGASGGTVDNCYNTGAVTGESNVVGVTETTTNIGGVVGFNQGAVVKNSYFLKIAGSTNKDLNAVGAGAPTATCGTFVDNVGTLTPETGSSIIGSKTNLLDALNAGVTAYNGTESGAETPAMAWVKVADDYPTLKAGGVTPPTPPAGGGDSDSEPSISPEDIFWTRVVSDLKLKDEPVVEFNCKYPRMSRRVLLALQEVDKTLNVNLNGEKISITSKQVKSLTFDKASYSVAELKALLEVKPEVTPTPTPTPTQKPTEPVVPEKPTANLTWLWILLAVIAVGAVVAFVVIKRKKK